MSEAGGFSFITARLLNGASGTPPVDIPRDPAREAARRELTDPAYHQNDPSLLQRALDTFWDWVGSLFDSASGATPGGPLGLVVIVARHPRADRRPLVAARHPAADRHLGRHPVR